MWYVKNDKVGTYPKTPDVTYTKNVKSKEVYADMDLSDPYTYSVVIDGKASGTFTAAKRDDTTKLSGNGRVGNGSDVEVYEKTIVVVNEYLMQVAGDYNEKKEELTLTTLTENVSNSMVFSTLTLKSDDFAGLDEYKDEEYVLVTAAWNGTNYDIKSIKPAEKITGVVSEYVDNDTVTAGGTEYSYAVSAVAAVKNFAYSVKDSYDLYVDSCGYVLLAEGVEAEDDVVYITEFARSSRLTTNGNVVAYGYFLDGTEAEITVSKLNGSKVTAASLPAPTYNALNGKTEGWYKFSGKDGVYTLRELAIPTDYTLDTIAGSAVTVVDYSVKHTAIDAQGHTLKGNASTKFVVVKPNGDVVTYEGIKNVADITAAVGSKVAMINTGAYAKYVFIQLASGSTIRGGSTSSDLIYVMKLDATSGHDNDSDTYYRYKAVVNGEVKKVKFDDGSYKIGRAHV